MQFKIIRFEGSSIGGRSTVDHELTEQELFIQAQEKINLLNKSFNRELENEDLPMHPV